MTRGLIGDIGRYALHDGPGIRTTVFCKGCPLHCPWCHNPEFIDPRVELALQGERCIGCGECVDCCPEGALAVVDGTVRLDRGRCTGCGGCVEVCPTRALELVGREFTPSELVELLLRDRRFYEVSGGGVTLSGGEPTLQLAFCGELLARLKRAHVHTALETNGLFAWEAFATTCLPHLDLVLFDVKLIDPLRHWRAVGAGNEVILANLARLQALRPEDVLVRVPLIPGWTADAANLGGIAAHLRNLGVQRVSLLPYHPHGLDKAARVGRAVPPDLPPQPMDQASQEACRRLFAGCTLVPA